MVVPVGRLVRDPLLMREMFEIPLTQRIECVHAQDVARALTNAVNCDAVLGRILLIGGGQLCQVLHRDFVQRAFDEIGIGALPAKAFSSVPYHTDWLDTDESERLLRYQRHTFEDYLRETRHSIGPARAAIQVLRPFVRWLVLRQSPYLS
jgi:hypothetical protein